MFSGLSADDKTKLAQALTETLSDSLQHALEEDETGEAECDC